MASVEIASMLAPYANYYIASEKTEPGTGWNYAFMSVLNNSGMNGVGADYKNGDLQIVQAPIDKDKNDYYCIFHIYDVYGNVTVSELIPFSEQIS